MISHVSPVCDTSPQSTVAIEAAIALRGNQYNAVATLLTDDFIWTTPGSDYAITKEQLKHQMDHVEHPDVVVESVTILTAMSNGPYAAVTSHTRMSNAIEFHSHDLIEFSSNDELANESLQISKVTSYTVDIKQ